MDSKTPLQNVWMSETIVKNDFPLGNEFYFYANIFYCLAPQHDCYEHTLSCTYTFFYTAITKSNLIKWVSILMEGVSLGWYEKTVCIKGFRC